MSLLFLPVWSSLFHPAVVSCLALADVAGSGRVMDTHVKHAGVGRFIKAGNLASPVWHQFGPCRQRAIYVNSQINMARRLIYATRE